MAKNRNLKKHFDFFADSSSDDENVKNVQPEQKRESNSSNANSANQKLRDRNSRVPIDSRSATSLGGLSDDEFSTESSSDSSTKAFNLSDDEETGIDSEPMPTEPIVEEDNEWQDITDSEPNFEEHVGRSETFVPSGITDPGEFYRLFLTDEIIDKIVLETNKYAAKNIESENLKQNSRAKLWKPTNREEMMTFLG